MFKTVNKVKCLNERRCYVLADVIIFLYEVLRIFWHYINVDEVSRITQKIIAKWDGIITNCDSLVYYKVRWTVITNCDSFFITKCDTVYYKLLQVLQSAMDLLQIATGITILAYMNRYFTENSRWVPLFSCHLQLPDRIERHWT